MVLAAVLCRARLSADLHTRQDGSRHAASGATRTSVYSGTHAFHHHFIIFAVDGGITGIAIDAVQFIVFYLLHDVRSNEMPPVGNGGTQIGYLQRGGENLSLPDGDTNHRQTVPRTPIGLVVELCIRYQSTLFAGEVGTEPIAEALRYHVVFPYGNGILRRTVFFITEHAIQSPTEIGITRGSDGRNQRQRRTMSVTSHMKAFMIETMRTRESRIIFVDNLFLKESQCLRRLEGGARRISSHDGTVQQRLPLVHLQQAVVLSPLAPYHQMRVKGRRGNHT